MNLATQALIVRLVLPGDQHARRFRCGIVPQQRRQRDVRSRVLADAGLYVRHRQAVVLQPGQAGIYSYPPGTFGARLDRELWWENHECAPDGCLKPIGCGNHWTEKKFIFGSCRQFFGTAWSTVGHGRGTVER